MDLKARNEEIRKQYERMARERKYLDTYICETIAKRWHISAATIEAIVFRRGYYKDK